MSLKKEVLIAGEKCLQQLKNYHKLCTKQQKEIKSLRSQLDDERKHSDIILQQRDESIGDLSQAKEDIESLLAERDEWKARAEELYNIFEFDLYHHVSKEDFARIESWFRNDDKNTQSKEE